MKEKQTNQKECRVEKCNTDYINQLGGSPMYNIFLLQGSGKVSVDLVEYIFEVQSHYLKLLIKLFISIPTSQLR